MWFDHSQLDGSSEVEDLRLFVCLSKNVQIHKTFQKGFIEWDEHSVYINRKLRPFEKKLFSSAMSAPDLR